MREIEVGAALPGGGKRTQINDRAEVIGDRPRWCALLRPRLTRSLLSATLLSYRGRAKRESFP